LSTYELQSYEMSSRCAQFFSISAQTFLSVLGNSFFNIYIKNKKKTQELHWVFIMEKKFL